jgi:hypothetical protein
MILERKLDIHATGRFPVVFILNPNIAGHACGVFYLQKKGGKSNEIAGQ